MNKTGYRIVSLGGMSLLAATASHAHAPAVLGDTSALMAGVSHPLLGWDHLLAAVAVGLWAGWQAGRARPVVLPMLFIGATVAGGIVAHVGLTLPFVEAGIAMSLLLPGLLLAFAAQPSWTASATAAAFALFHGYAHGSALPEAAQAAWYGLGIAASTAVLLAMGVVVGWLARREPGSGWRRWAGGAIAAAGVFTWV